MKTDNIVEAMLVGIRKEFNKKFSLITASVSSAPWCDHKIITFKLCKDTYLHDNRAKGSWVAKAPLCVVAIINERIVGLNSVCPTNYGALIKRYSMVKTFASMIGNAPNTLPNEFDFELSLNDPNSINKLYKYVCERANIHILNTIQLIPKLREQENRVIDTANKHLQILDSWEKEYNNGSIQEILHSKEEPSPAS